MLCSRIVEAIRQIHPLRRSRVPESDPDTAKQGTLKTIYILYPWPNLFLTLDL